MGNLFIGRLRRVSDNLRPMPMQTTKQPDQ
jgi:hypothetical protein